MLGNAWSSVKSGFQEKVESTQKQKADDKFSEWLATMLSLPKFTLEEFRTTVQASAADAGITGWRSMLPGANDAAGVAEVKKTMSILDAMLPLERQQPKEFFGRLEKLRVSQACKLNVHEVNAMLKNWTSASVVHAWLHQRQKKGASMPMNQQSLHMLMQLDRPPQLRQLSKHRPRNR